MKYSALLCVLTLWPTGTQSAPILPEPASKILFTSKVNGVYHLFLMNEDGTGMKQITQGKKHHLFPNWSPDGKKIICTIRPNRSDAHLMIMNPDGSGVNQITSGTVHDRGASWSPDGKRIAFTRNVPRGNQEVYVIELANNKVKNLSNNPGFDADPIWSADGKKIVFTSYRPQKDTSLGQGFMLHVMNADGSNQTLLVPRPNQNGYSYPAWSQKGKHIVFGHTPTGKSEIELFQCDADGKNLKQLTSLGGVNSYPAWSSKDDKIVFQHHERRGQDGTLYLLDVKTGKTKRIRGDFACPMEGGRPVWQPRK